MSAFATLKLQAQRTNSFQFFNEQYESPHSPHRLVNLRQSLSCDSPGQTAPTYSHSVLALRRYALFGLVSFSMTVTCQQVLKPGSEAG